MGSSSLRIVHHPSQLPSSPPPQLSSRVSKSQMTSCSSTSSRKPSSSPPTSSSTTTTGGVGDVGGVGNNRVPQVSGLQVAPSFGIAQVEINLTAEALENFNILVEPVEEPGEEGVDPKVTPDTPPQTIGKPINFSLLPHMHLFSTLSWVYVDHAYTYDIQWEGLLGFVFILLFGYDFKLQINGSLLAHWLVALYEFAGTFDKWASDEIENPFSTSKLRKSGRLGSFSSGSLNFY